jgi:hypothetical protein
LAGGFDGEVNAIAIFDGSVYAGGRFAVASNSGGDISASSIARWDGSQWSALGADPGANGNGVNSGLGLGVVQALAAGGGSLYVGGIFNQASNSSVDHAHAANFVKWNGASWSALGATGGNGVNDQVMAIAVKGDEVFVGGWFTKVGSLSVNRIAKWNGLTNTWSALGPSPGARGNGVSSENCSGHCDSGFVAAIAVSGDDVYVGGSFDTVYNGSGGALAAANIARWSALTNNWSTVGGGVNGFVRTIHSAGGDVYAGGAFNTVVNSDHSSINTRNIARWNTTTNTWAAFGDGSNTNANGVDGGVIAIGVKGNEVYVAGSFTNACNSISNCVNANYVARWNKLTNTWSALGSDSGPTGNGLKLWSNNAGSVRDLVVLGNDVYVCGGFEAAYNSNSSSLLTSGIARWNGSTWSALGSGTSDTGQGLSNGPALKMAAVGTDLYVIGHFIDTANNSETDHVQINGIAKWNGATWSALGSGLIPSDDNSGGGGYGAGLAATATHLYAGGFFAYTGGKITANFGRYRFPVNCPVTISPSQRTVPKAGANGHVNVNAQGSCSWTAVSNVPWITITSVAGSKVNYTVASNASGSQRIGTITISGQTLTIRQL